MDRERHRTMDELARASGISRPTLSKYFDDPNSVRSSTRLRVEEALRGSDYRPNLFARNLNRRRTRAIGVIVPHLIDPFYADLVSRIEGRCVAAGYWPIVVSSHGSRETEARAIDLLMSLKVAGAIVTPLGTTSNESLLTGLHRDMPIIYCDTAVDGRAPAVRNDNRQSVSTMVEYLCRTGDAPSYFDMPDVNRNTAERRATYIAAMERLGHEPTFLGLKATTRWDFEELGFEAMLRAIDDKKLPSQTILCSNDRIAFGVMAAAFARKIPVGRRRGRGLRVAGHDDHPMSRFSSPPLTTMAQDTGGMATQAVEMLLALIGDEASEAPSGPMVDVVLEARLVMRHSA